jgi:hypothetical protein
MQGLSGYLTKRAAQTFSTEFFRSGTGKVAAKLLIGMSKMGSNALGEAGEEILAGIIEPHIIRATYDPNYRIPTTAGAFAAGGGCGTDQHRAGQRGQFERSAANAG